MADRAYYFRNHEERKAYQREYYHNNKEKCLAYMKTYQREHVAEIVEAKKSCRERKANGI